MSAQLPYLPPIQRYNKDVQDIAKGAAEDVHAAQGAAAKAGQAVRGVLATVPAAVRAANDVVATPARVVADQAGTFVRNVFGVPQPSPAPSLGLPQLAAPGAPPATAAPVVTDDQRRAEEQYQAVKASQTTSGDLQSARAGNSVVITGNGAPVAPAMKGMPIIFRSSPIAEGIAQQRAYAAAQQERVLAGAEEAAAAGHPGNASYRYAAALNALPHLAGTNNFGSAQGQLEGERISAAERERANIRTTNEMRHATDERADEVRRNVQPVVIGEEPNPDPATRVFQPFIKKYGFVHMDKDKVVVRDFQGNVINGPKAAPVPRSEFIQKNKQANPNMSEADIGREWDKKYGGKS